MSWANFSLSNKMQSNNFQITLIHYLLNMPYKYNINKLAKNTIFIK